MFESKETTAAPEVDQSKLYMAVTGINDFISNNARKAKVHLLLSPEFFGNSYINPEKAVRTYGLVVKEASCTSDMFDYILSCVKGKSFPMELQQIQLVRHGNFPNVWYTLDGIEFKEEVPFEKGDNKK